MRGRNSNVMEDQAVLYTATQMENLALDMSVEKEVGHANIEECFTAETEPIANLSEKSKSWGSSESMDDGLKLDMILSFSNDEGDACEIWYADTPSTCGDKSHCMELPDREIHFFSDSYHEPKQNIEPQAQGYGHLVSTGLSGSAQEQKSFCAEGGGMPLTGKSELVEI